MDERAGALIEALGLAPHPEGGWYRETWRAEAADGARAGGTAIYFLLEAGQRSHWHRVDAAELWLWHAGDSLDLLVEQENGAVQKFALGGDVA
ncbi:MAG: cupin domain-containing protein, partial [Sphingomonas sp.]